MLDLISVFTCIGGQTVSVAAQTEKYFEKVLNLEQKGVESRYEIGTSLPQQTLTKGTKRNEILSYRLFEFYSCLHLYRWTKRVRCPLNREIFSNIFSVNSAKAELEDGTFADERWGFSR